MNKCTNTRDGRIYIIYIGMIVRWLYNIYGSLEQKDSYWFISCCYIYPWMESAALDTDIYPKHYHRVYNKVLVCIIYIYIWFINSLQTN